MGSVVLTTRHSAVGQVHSTALNRLADRWRPVGLFLACFGRDGSLLWQDSQMPRILSLCATGDATIPQLVRHLPESVDGHGGLPTVIRPFPGLHVHLASIARRRKVTGYLAVFARVDHLVASEELHRAASRAGVDVQALIHQGQRMAHVAATVVAPLVPIIAHMYEDFVASSTSQHELASVTEQLSATYEEINLLYKISSGMRFSQKPQPFLETVCKEVQEIGSFRAVALAFAHRDEQTSRPVIDDMALLVGNSPLQGAELLKALEGPILEALNANEAKVCNDLTQLPLFSALPDSLQRAVCVPLTRDHRPLGILLALDKVDHSEYSSVDIKLLNNVGSQCSIFLENAVLYQDMQGLFMGVLHALTRSIDAKDAYTRGHSQRVAQLSRDLAARIGLPDEQCERVYLSGLLHDVGKIGVPETVLTKPGRLSDAEFEAIKKHPAIGAQILGNIKQLADVVPGVLYHHERWDGRGYPYNLAAENIPLMGRIICVADSFDAMSSTRTYRPALPLDIVLAEITRCSGAQFDPALAKVFVGMDFGPYRRALDEQLAAPRIMPSSAGSVGPGGL